MGILDQQQIWCLQSSFKSRAFSSLASAWARCSGPPQDASPRIPLISPRLAAMLTHLLVSSHRIETVVVMMVCHLEPDTLWSACVSAGTIHTAIGASFWLKLVEINIHFRVAQGAAAPVAGHDACIDLLDRHLSN